MVHTTQTGLTSLLWDENITLKEDCPLAIGVVTRADRELGPMAGMGSSLGVESSSTKRNVTTSFVLLDPTVWKTTRSQLLKL
jgi:hypothetical protein